MGKWWKKFLRIGLEGPDTPVVRPPEASEDARKYANTIEALNVVDGDTVEVIVRVRLAGIKAPEKGEEGYEEAKLALEEMLPFLAKCDVWWALGRTTYGRLEAQITTARDGNLGLKLYERGLVEMQDEYKRIYGVG